MNRHDVYGQLLGLVDVLGSDLDRFLAEHNLTVARAHILWLLHGMGPTAQHQLARQLRVTPRNVTGLVDGLTTAGLVERTPHPTDRRSVIISLTESGREFASSMDADRVAIAEKLFSEWSEDELEGFSRLLRRCTDTLRAEVRAT